MTISTPDATAVAAGTPPSVKAEAVKQPSRQDNLAKAYQSATAKLRDAHREEFNALYQAAAEALGEKWTPRPNAQEKARQDLLALLEAHPDLADEVAARIAK